MDYYISRFNIKSIIKVTEDVYTIIIEGPILQSKPESTISKDQLSQLIGEKHIPNKLLRSIHTDTVKSNVAIAAAITSYARIYIGLRS